MPTIDFMLYAGLFMAALFSECSSKINTRTVGKKVGLLFITIGALLSLEHKANDFIVIGVLIYLFSNILAVYFNRKRRRRTDLVNRLNQL